MVNALKATWHQLKGLNLFIDPEKNGEETEEEIRGQVLTTRVYLVLLISSVCVLVLYTSLTKGTASVTISRPSMATYRQLEEKYPHTLLCPCQQVSVPYSAFVSITPRYHQICSSDLLSDVWLNSLYNMNTTRISPLDFRPLAITFFRLISIHCSFASEAIGRIKEMFKTKRHSSKFLLRTNSFNDQASKVLLAFHAQVDNLMVSSASSFYTVTALRQSKVYSALHTNAFTTTLPGSDQYQVINNIYPLNQNATITTDSFKGFGFCSPFSTVTYQAAIYDWAIQARPFPEIMSPHPPPVHVIPGLKVGCLPYDGMVASTLECFFSAQCLNDTAKWLSKLPPTQWPSPLNSSLLKTLRPSDTILHLLDNKLIDDWQTAETYSSYYAACAPLECTYTYQSYKDFVYLLSTVMGLCGGLIVALRTAVPVLVQLTREFYAKLRQRYKSTRTPVFVISQGRYGKMKQITRKAKDFIKTFNIFTQQFDNRQLGLYATRIYITLLCSGTIIFTLYSSFTVYSRRVTVSNLSLEKFEELHNTYPESLTCPCSQISISYSKIIVSASPRFHSFCTSGFINPGWITDIFTIRFENGTEPVIVSDDDFRARGLPFFLSTTALCIFSMEAVRVAQNVFLQGEFISATAFSRNDFSQRILSITNDYKNTIIPDRIYTVSILRRIIAATGIQHGMELQTVNTTHRPILRRYSPAPPALNVCTCSVASDCPDPLWSGGKFICQNGNNCTSNTVVWRVPGLVKGCSMAETLNKSNLGCLYNRTCITTLLSMLYLDMPNRLPLLPETSAVIPLNSSSQSNFRPTDSIGAIFDRLMLEEWKIEGDFELYYNACNPTSCTYVLNRRMDLVYVIAAVIGLVGGLSVSLDLLVPVGVYLVHWAIMKRRANQMTMTGEHTRRRSIWQRVDALTKTATQKLSELNLFRIESSTSRRNDAQQLARIASRFYTLLLLTAMLTLSLFNGLALIDVLKTDTVASMAQFEDLQARYPTTISCPCQQIAIPYETFLTLNPKYHPICSSPLINMTWIVSLYGYGPSAKSYNQLDRPLLSKYFQIMKDFCEEAATSFAAVSAVFYETTLVTTSALSRNSFNTEAEKIVNDFIKLFPTDSRRVCRYYADMIIYNLLPNAFNTDWSLEFGSEADGYIIRHIPRLYGNGSCNCLVSRQCQSLLRIGPADIVLPGLLVSCSTIDGLRMSTLECFYSSDCMNTIITYLDYYTQVDGSPAVNFTPSSSPSFMVPPLNDRTLSRFSRNSTIGAILDELFVDSWNTTISYEKYYNACAPLVCQYEFGARNSVVYIVTLLLSLYGGLTIGLRMVSWNLALCYSLVKNRLYISRNNVETIARHQSF